MNSGTRECSWNSGTQGPQEPGRVVGTQELRSQEPGRVNGTQELRSFRSQGEWMELRNQEPRNSGSGKTGLI